MAEDKCNRKNPTVKRILQEVIEMESNPSDDFMSLPLEILMHAAVIIALLFILKSYDTSSTDDICSAPKFGSPEREKLIDEIHEFMLTKAPPVPQGSQGSKVQATIEENEIEGVEEELQNLVVEDGIVAEEPNETPSNAIVVQNSQPIAAMSTTELK